jgi:hypothetical protein
MCELCDSRLYPSSHPEGNFPKKNRKRKSYLFHHQISNMSLRFLKCFRYHHYWMNERALWYFAYTFSTDLRGLGPVRIHSVPFKGHTNCFWFIVAYISFLKEKSSNSTVLNISYLDCSIMRHYVGVITPAWNPIKWIRNNGPYK